MNNSMTIAQCLEHIKSNYGKIISIKFIKRKTGELREMVFRQGVKKHLVKNPSKPGIDFSANGLLSVYEMPHEGYKAIPINGIVEIKVNGEWVKVLQPQFINI
jgi:hypothetical protein